MKTQDFGVLFFFPSFFHFFLFFWVGRGAFLNIPQGQTSSSGIKAVLLLTTRCPGASRRTPRRRDGGIIRLSIHPPTHCPEPSRCPSSLTGHGGFPGGSGERERSRPGPAELRR